MGFNDVQRVKEWRGRNPDRYKLYMREFMKKKRERNKVRTDVNEAIVEAIEIEAEAHKAEVELIKKQVNDKDITVRQLEGLKRRRG